MITTTKLDPIETASRDELQALQTQRLKWTLKHAYENVPMYRRKFDAAGVHPDDFRELNDLQKFPCTTKQDLRDNYPFDTFAVPMGAGGAHSRLFRHHRQTDGGGVYAKRY